MTKIDLTPTKDQYAIEYDYWFKPHSRAKREDWTRVRKTVDKHPMMLYDSYDDALDEVYRMKESVEEVDNFTIHEIKLADKITFETRF